VRVRASSLAEVAEPIALPGSLGLCLCPWDVRQQQACAQAALLVKVAYDPANAQRLQRCVWQGLGPWGATTHSAPGSDRIK
jgi:hypothetical protein